MALLPITKSFVWVAFGLMVHFVVNLEGSDEIVGETVLERKSYDDDRLFRMNKINLIFQKAKRVCGFY